MIAAITDFFGIIPAGYEWIVGVCAIILFTFIVSFVFSIFDFLFNLIGGGSSRGSRY